MCLGTFSRRAQSLATFFIFVRVRTPARSAFYFIGSFFGISYEIKRERLYDSKNAQALSLAFMDFS